MPKRRLPIETAEVVRLYVDERLSIHAIARRFDCHRDVIRTRLEEAGVELRTKEEAYDLATQVHGSYERPTCAWDERCTGEPRGYQGREVALCTYHAKRALGLLGPAPGDRRRA